MPAEEGLPLPQTLPWYFGLAIMAFWLVAVYGIVHIARHRFRQWRAERERSRRLAAARPGDVIDID